MIEGQDKGLEKIAHQGTILKPFVFTFTGHSLIPDNIYKIEIIKTDFGLKQSVSLDWEISWLLDWDLLSAPNRDVKAFSMFQGSLKQIRFYLVMHGFRVV
jgi:hypothetical protein